MPDNSLETSWLNMLDSIVLGARRYDERWTFWFAEMKPTAHFETRVRAVFDERGVVPSPVQFYRAQAALREKQFSEEDTDTLSNAAALEAQDETTEEAEDRERLEALREMADDPATTDDEVKEKLPKKRGRNA